VITSCIVVETIDDVDEVVEDTDRFSNVVVVVSSVRWRLRIVVEVVEGSVDDVDDGVNDVE
jgi:hypothetical protein